MLKILIKMVLFILVAVVLGCGIGTCSNDLAQASGAQAASDWKTCETKIAILNTTDKFLTYKLQWIDHDVAKLRDFLMSRAGGELAAHKRDIASENFRLCLGRHVITWELDGELFNQYVFNIGPGTTELIITPMSAISIKFAPADPGDPRTISLIKAVETVEKMPQSPAVMAIAEALLNEEAIKQALKENYAAFMRIAKVRPFGRSVTVSTSITSHGVRYKMSIRGTKEGIKTIGFTKEVRISKDVIDITYEGILGTGYYCYANRLFKAENHKLVPISAKSIFEQVFVKLFTKGDDC